MWCRFDAFVQRSTTIEIKFHHLSVRQWKLAFVTLSLIWRRCQHSNSLHCISFSISKNAVKGNCEKSNTTDEQWPRMNLCQRRSNVGISTKRGFSSKYTHKDTSRCEMLLCGTFKSNNWPIFFLSSINNWPENSIEKNMLIASTSEWKELIMLFGASRNEWNKHFPNVCVVCVLKCVAALLMKLLCFYFMNKCQMAMVVHTHHTCCQYSEGGKQLFRINKHQPCDLR